jgi:hypothetical protein
MYPPAMCEILITLILSPVINLLVGIFKRHKPVDVQAFIPKAAIEEFDWQTVFGGR